MFKKKKKIKCARCGKKIEKKFEFCPYCGFSLKQKDKNEFKDFTREFEKAMKMPFFVKFPFRQLVKQVEKQVDSQMRIIDKDLDGKRIDVNKMKKIPVSGINIKISAGGGEPRVVRIGNIGIPGAIESVKKPQLKKIVEKKGKSLEKTKIAKFAKLKKTEPEAKVRRLTDSVVYEISVPGVKSVKDVAITRLENSIEIKALAKDKAYFKLIPVSLPIKDYTLENEKLIIELVPWSQKK